MIHNVPINNKDIMEDWIYGIVNESYIETPNNGGNTRSIIGFFQKHLLHIEWAFDSNRIVFYLIDLWNYDWNANFKRNLEDYITIGKDDDTTPIYTELHKIRKNVWALDFLYDDNQ